MTGPASLRREWFLGKFSNESTVVPGSTPCSDSLSQSLLSSPTTVQVGCSDRIMVIVLVTVIEN